MKNQLKRFLVDCAGNTVLFFALGAVPLCAAVGAAVDFSRASEAQAALQAAVDAAALAAGANSTLSDEEVAALVQSFFAANTRESLKSGVAVTADIDRTNNSLSISVHGSVDTSLMRVVGYNKLNVSVSSSVNIGSQSLELAMVLDNTLSMDGQKIVDLKVAAKDAVQILSETVSINNKVKIALVPFAWYVNVGVDNRNESWIDVPKDDATHIWKGCVGSRPSPLDANIERSDKYTGVMSQECPGPIVPLTDDFAMLKTTINDMTLKYGTFIPGGLLWGWHVLDDKKPFTEAMNEGRRKKIGGRRAILLMTDGSNSVQSTPSTQPEHEPSEEGNSPLADALMHDTCINAKAQGILIYTVGFQIPSESTKTLLRECATFPTMAYDAQDGEALKAAFRGIVSELGKLHLTQ